ncbi:Rapid ALkalinization Factor protein [Dioscorea alata]|uniref:Rapid ALkalinization Factor protein n=1 Tax=Dioscorea alata TaxID=55571 RepID=A0ACB7VH40_DIOAL|nr:Rapid ALkalinization Factor protein [Dioscorea alata]
MKMKAICWCIVFHVLLQVMMMMNTMPVAAVVGEYNGSDFINARDENWLLASEADQQSITKQALDADKPACNRPQGLPCVKPANPGAGRGCKKYYGCTPTS